MREKSIVISGQKKISESGIAFYRVLYSFFELSALLKFRPIFVSGYESAEEIYYLAKNSNGLILSGGGDVNPQLYGEENTDSLSINIEDERDTFEFQLIDTFRSHKKAILGICRGSQILNVYFGGSLYQDIEKCLNIEYPYNSNHLIKLTPDGFLGKLFATDITVNSLHHQAIKDLAPDLVAVARNSKYPDIIEAFEHSSEKVYGTQWHPDLMFGDYIKESEFKDMLPLFRYIFDFD